MCARRIEFESETIQYEDALVTLHKIKGENDDTPISPLHTHSYFELLLMVDGDYVYHTENGDITAHKGELLIIPPTMAHRAFHGDTASRIAVLGIDIAAPQGKGRFYTYFESTLQTFAGVPLPLPQNLFRKFLNYYLAPQRHGIRQLCARKREACDLLSALWDMLGQSEPALSETSTTAPDIVLETLVNSKNVKLSAIAAQLGYSQRQVQRKIKDRYGKNLRELRKELQ